jgi:hypothetical protein
MHRQSASSGFVDVNKFLEDIYKKLTDLDAGNPVFLAVPGNHDLRRSDGPLQPAESVFQNLTSLPPDEEEEVWKAIFGKKSGYRKFIQKMFAAYEEWWRPKFEDASQQLSARKPSSRRVTANSVSLALTALSFRSEGGISTRSWDFMCSS